MRNFEDWEVGYTERFGRYQVEQEEVLAFSRAFDPQPFHLDDAAAADNPIFGKIPASGWHTACIATRMFVDHAQQSGRSFMGSPGLDELRWLKPVFPGDTLSLEVEVVGKSEPRSKPDIGFIKFRTTVLNQNNEPVMQQVASLIQRKRTD